MSLPAKTPATEFIPVSFGRYCRLAMLLATLSVACPATASNSWSDVVFTVNPKMVKIFGAGGLRGLESYQSGFFISAKGHVLTTWSYVLDTESVAVVTSDGQRLEAELIGADPHLEIAILKVAAAGMAYFDLQATTQAVAGDRVLAFGNLFGVAVGDEQPTVLHGNIVTHTHLAARRGAYKSRYQGPVYVLDAMTNNPGAPGGALTDGQGRLLGLLGKELRNTHNNTWLNYAIPVPQMTNSVSNILSGKILPRTLTESTKLPDNPHTVTKLGIVLVPNLLDKTPPFVERVIGNSLAAKAGLQPDDLILFIREHSVPAITDLHTELKRVHQDDELRLQILRKGELIEVLLKFSS